MKIKKTGSYSTRSGLPVRIYAVDGGGLYPVHGAIKVKYSWSHEGWTESGKYISGAKFKPPQDLIEIKPKKRVGKNK